MDNEHEMCQNCKRDIPVKNYRMHTLHCARTVTTCPDCGDPVSKDLLDSHHQQFHSPRDCPMCGISVQAVKLHSHKKNDCPKRNISCKYCQIQKPAGQIRDHESYCGNTNKSCSECSAKIVYKDFEAHRQRHKEDNVRKSRYQTEHKSLKDNRAQTLPRGSTINGYGSESTTMLPCEFCEAMVPMYKLLEHQAECVNPSNVRGGGGTGIVRSHSMYATGSSRRNCDTSAELVRRKSSAPNQIERNGRDSSSNDDNYLPCEFCGQSFLSEYIMRHQMNCEKNPHRTDFSARRTGSYLTRASSYRETRASTEERHIHPIRSSLSRQSSFTSASRQRRGESLTRQSSFSRNYFSHRSTYDYSSPSVRRSSIFDGYSGFAIYSSISQGLDEITYGGRRSRRNSITDSAYSRTGDSFTLPTLLAMQTASGATPTTPVSPNAHSNSNDHPLSPSTSESRPSLTRKDSERGTNNKSSPKIARKVSFTRKEPVVIDPDTSQKKEKKKKKRDKSQERKKKRQSNSELLEEVNDKLKVIEAQQKLHEVESPKEPFTNLESIPPSSLFPLNDPPLPKETKKISDERQTPKEPLTLSIAKKDPSPPPPQPSVPEPQTLKDVTNEIQLRPKSGGSKAGSKRNSLDSKTVQGLAQDLAAECAKAYALMESSLSKLSTDFSVSPFGISPKKKSSRKSRAAPPLK